MPRIFSCSSVETPMLSKASRVPQSGQIYVLGYFLERAGTPPYCAPQSATRCCKVFALAAHGRAALKANTWTGAKSYFVIRFHLRPSCCCSALREECSRQNRSCYSPQGKSEHTNRSASPAAVPHA